jgi:hypothetical protein
MNPREERAREIQQRIREVLLRDWDPIGVGKEPDLNDEYDAYIGGVYRLLASGAGPRAVAEHIAQIETEQMGFGTSPDKLVPLAEKLCALNVKLGVSDGAV